MKTDYTEFTFTQLLNSLKWSPDFPYRIKELFTRVKPTYKVYTAIITQTSTNTPTAEVFENNIGNIVWTREEAGSYVGTLTNAFVGKTICFTTLISGQANTAQLISGKVDNNTVNINVNDSTDGSAMDLAGTLSLEIRVYN